MANDKKDGELSGSNESTTNNIGKVFIGRYETDDSFFLKAIDQKHPLKPARGGGMSDLTDQQIAQLTTAKGVLTSFGGTLPLSKIANGSETAKVDVAELVQPGGASPNGKTPAIVEAVYKNTQAGYDADLITQRDALEAMAHSGNTVGKDIKPDQALTNQAKDILKQNNIVDTDGSIATGLARTATIVAADTKARVDANPVDPAVSADVQKKPAFSPSSTY